jgi:hypothetical protein
VGEKMMPDQQETLKWRMTNAAIALTKESVTPILATRNGIPIHAGTGTLFELGEHGQHKLMVTAAHVFHEIRKYKSHPVLSDAGNENEPIATVELSGRSELCDEPLDIAITLLGSQTIDRLPKRRYLPFSAVEIGTVFPGAFCVGGFPASLGLEASESNLISGCMICTKLYTGSTATFSGVDPMWHILIDRMDGTGCTDGQGRPAGLPDSLGGASGSPLLQSYKDGLRFGDWTPDHVRVVGVMTGEWREAMLATRWAAVLMWTYNLFPELREDLKKIGMVPNRIQMPAAFYG